MYTVSCKASYAVQDGGQLPGDRSVGSGQAAGRTESLVVAAAESVKEVQEGELVGLLKVGLWASTLENLKGDITHIFVLQEGSKCGWL